MVPGELPEHPEAQWVALVGSCQRTSDVPVRHQGFASVMSSLDQPVLPQIFKRVLKRRYYLIYDIRFVSK